MKKSDNLSKHQKSVLKTVIILAMALLLTLLAVCISLNKYSISSKQSSFKGEFIEVSWTVQETKYGSPLVIYSETTSNGDFRNDYQLTRRSKIHWLPIVGYFAVSLAIAYIAMDFADKPVKPKKKKKTSKKKS